QHRTDHGSPLTRFSSKRAAGIADAHVWTVHTVQRPTVLVVEDEFATREMLRDLLSDAGYHVVTAEDGATALGALDRSEVWPDLVILDMRMPFMDGPTFFECLRSRAESRDTPVLVVSGTLRRSIRGEVSGIRILHKPSEVSHL